MLKLIKLAKMAGVMHCFDLITGHECFLVFMYILSPLFLKFRNKRPLEFSVSFVSSCWRIIAYFE